MSPGAISPSNVTDDKDFGVHRSLFCRRLYSTVPTQQIYWWQTFCVSVGKCPAGEYSSTGYEPCVRCPRGSYQPDVGSTDCITCVGYQSTLAGGSQLLSACLGRLFLHFLLLSGRSGGTTETWECIRKWWSNTFPSCSLFVLTAAATLACVWAVHRAVYSDPS